MTLPAIIDLQAITAIGMLVLIFMQYIKDAIPDKLMRVCSLLVGIGISFLWFYKPGNYNFDFIMIIANGIFGAIGADTGYQFLSPSGSQVFSLPGKIDKPAEKTPEPVNPTK
ncbi:MAG: hypothetical protein KKE05_04575 [Nanoarchaeota archaeon]|nr:hypothetical protein [Nanoarchaeota archaeon]